MLFTDRIEQQKVSLGMGRVIKNILGFPFYSLGWLGGKTWWGLHYITSAIILGFKDGAGWT